MAAGHVDAATGIAGCRAKRAGVRYVAGAAIENDPAAFTRQRRHRDDAVALDRQRIGRAGGAQRGFSGGNRSAVFDGRAVGR
jgi:hypothetical protein